MGQREICRSFNSRPHEEVDRAGWALTDCRAVLQLTTSRRGRLTAIEGRRTTNKLQLTTSRRGRLYSLNNILDIYMLQLTTSRRGRPYIRISASPALRASTHDLTKRSTLPRTAGLCYTSCFNSRPHEEVD